MTPTQDPMFKEGSAHFRYRYDFSIGQVYDYDSADDGPEVEMIRFFTRFPQGAIKGLMYWRRFVHAVNPNAGFFD